MARIQENQNASSHKIALDLVLKARQRKNPRYSIRAMARDIGVHPSTLSAIFGGKRNLPQSQISRVGKKIKDIPGASALLESSFRDGVCAIPIDSLLYEIVAEWEYAAILTLLDCANYESSSRWIAERLQLEESRVKHCLQNLVSAGLLVVEESGKLRKPAKNIETTEDIASKALRASHFEALRQAHGKLESIDLETHDFSSVTFTMSFDKIPKVKKEIRAFRKRLQKILESESNTEIYQLNLQLFPLTKILKKDTK